MQQNYQYIVIEGNIGAGKTTLTKAFCDQFDAIGLYEQFVDNPFLPLFYENPKKYALQLELSFLLERIQQMNEEMGSTLFHSAIIADYYLKKSLIFAAETLSSNDYELYSRIFKGLTGNLPEPNLYIYLHQNPEQLLKNIAKRGRTYESNISAEYLSNIQKSYFRFFKQIQNYPIVVVDCTNIDFITSKHHLEWFYNLTQKEWKNGYNIITPQI